MPRHWVFAGSWVVICIAAVTVAYEFWIAPTLRRGQKPSKMLVAPAALVFVVVAYVGLFFALKLP
jgi:hypothetical protein